MSKQLPHLGVSSCLLGESVRYDGACKRDPLIADVLASKFQFVSICPEVAIGLGVPRAPIQLVETKKGVKVCGVFDRSVDKTEVLDDFARQQAEALDDIHGYIFKARSPSCGLQDVNVWDSAGQIVRSDGIGIYTRALLAERPFLLIADEKQLRNEEFREQFIHQVYVRAG